MNTPVFWAAMSGALVYLISAFLPYWLAKKAGQRIAGIFYLVVSLVAISIACVLLGMMIPLVFYGFGSEPIGPARADKIILQAMGLPWLAVMFGAYVGRRGRVRGADAHLDTAHAIATPVNATTIVQGRTENPIQQVGVEVDDGASLPAKKLPQWAGKAAFGLFLVGIYVAVAALSSRTNTITEYAPPPSTESDDLAHSPSPQPTGTQESPIATSSETANNADSIKPAPRDESDEQQAINEHYARIYAVHPDAMEIVQSAHFQQWLSTRPGNRRHIESGTSDEVNVTLSAFKASLIPPPPAPPKPRPDEQYHLNQAADALARMHGQRTP